MSFKRNINDILETLANRIKDGFFSLEQKIALAKAIGKYSGRFALIRPILIWAFETKDSIILLEVIDCVLKAQGLNAFMLYYGYNQTVLEEIVQNSEFRKVLSKALSTNQILDLFKLVDRHGQTILHISVKDPKPS